LGGTTDNILNIQQNRAIRTCLNKKNKSGSTKDNYIEHNVSPVSLLYKKIIVCFIFKKCSPLDNILNKRGIIAYNIKIDYAKKHIGQKLVNCLEPKIFNSLNLNVKKNT